MYNKKFFVGLALFAGLFFAGCGKDKKDDLPKTGSVDNVDVSTIMNTPYSQLSPEQQKVKLENESVDFLNQFTAAQKSPAIEAIQYLSDLLDIKSPDVPDPIKEVNDVKEIFDMTNVTGVFTWDKNKWTESKSSSELKFVFPAKKGASSNNASLSVKFANSGTTFTETWTDEKYEGGKWVEYERESVIYLPKSATATLTIDKKEAAKIESGAEYKDKKEVPVSSAFKMTTSDGYEYWAKVEKGAESKVSMKMSFNKKSMLEGMAKTNAKIDEIADLLLEDDYSDNDIYKRLGKADAYLKLMDDLMIAYAVTDLEKYVRTSNEIWDWYIEKDDNLYYDYYYSNRDKYWEELGKLEKEYTEKEVKLFNDYMKASLVSTKDNTKIADLVMKAEPSEYDDWYYQEYYSAVYLKFGDGTQTEAEAYFGSGFNKLEKEWEDLLDGFNR